MRALLSRRAALAPAPLRALSTSVLFAGDAPARASPPPVPVGPGEVLVSSGGASTLRTYMASWSLSLLVSLGSASHVALRAALDPEFALFSPLHGGLAAASGLVLYLAASTSRCLVRAAVLEASGAHLRVYPYGALFRPGAPVRVPVRLLAESDGATARADTEALYARVRAGASGRLSAQALVFDKHLRESALVPRGAGSGLAWTPRGLAPHCAPPPPAPDAPPRARADAAAFRTYALLAWLLQGHAVADPARLAAGDWTLEGMTAELGARAGAAHASPAARAAAAAAARAHWRRAHDAQTGRDYWFDELTWETTWAEPGEWGADAAGR